ncbi:MULTISPECIES: sigma-54-dependent transcriptional regulator [Pseudomonas]|uniref:Sigma-54-dependent Fis family transcriptional regulator n=1 Tax=Pseudomonas quercus TaxID=2722792 RepID=A0ABX0YD39_9PSED|nr:MULTISPECIES: sigma-54 dependent transcriptional regulator [Pseudomonas]MBF7141615.1 sigma-54-dependent Fis family transcriptional regulator [Pseudomonas sp. LY10J]NJP00154.1 sigma-54-dependent Fis family transcriptional regulator [Pseudomonas quercus]
MTAALTVLIVEDDPHVMLGCQQALGLEDIVSEGVATAELALQRISQGFAGIVVSDIRLPGIDGLQLLRQLKDIDPALPVMLITGHGDVALAVSAMRQGAYDFMEKPFSSERLVEAVRRALEQRRLTLQVSSLQRQLQHREALHERLIGHSVAMQALRAAIANVADTPANVLITGETGTGKELVARCLHDYSRRHPHAFVALNCGGLSDPLFDSEIFGHEASSGSQRVGKLEHAHEGTLFLDEVEALPAALQVRMLRVLQERTLERLGSNQPVAVDIRVIAATKADMAHGAHETHLRSDFFYRLNVVTLELPPLRSRREDIPVLFEHFLQQAALRFDRDVRPLDDVTRSRLMTHGWPGNVRELRNVAERFALGMPAFRQDDTQSTGLRFAEAVEAFERSLLQHALARNGGNLSQASQELGMAKTTLFDRVKKYRLTEPSIK